MKSSLDAGARWTSVWDQIRPSDIPPAGQIASALGVPKEAAERSLKLLWSFARAFEESMAKASDNEQRAVLGMYLHAMGVLDQGRLGIATAVSGTAPMR
jgi:hypothetical protein